MKALHHQVEYILLIFILIGCAQTSSNNNIFQDLEYIQIKDIAASSEKYFCIILVDSSYNISKYKNKITEIQNSQQAVWNFTNIQLKQNMWYKLLLGTEKVPFTLIFSKNGELKNIVYGISKYALKSIESTLHSAAIHNPYFGFSENSIISIEPQKINTFFNQMIDVKYKLPNNDRLYSNITNNINEFEYPYNLYLKIKYLEDIQNYDSCHFYSQKLLKKYENAYYTSIFKPIFLEINKKMNSSDTTNKLQLLPLSNTYKCHLTDTLKIRIQAINNTSTTIKIEEIEPSCNCIKQTGHSSTTILPKDTIEYEFYFIPEEKGKLYREIYFHTDYDRSVVIVDFEILVE